ncbi:hypothetical protein Geob_0181 [Geotalea daltonii FRC-32]|uniref:PKD/Chitinase domain-containing protein n=1 Tax=Geotalea daltonii (strain DSM 22248 / JCM 15807 / FRC-32) TaxID=316067 RepID=B9M8L9_GEODF|nr:PKD domain-containing protein [Geotalea daltonii]ACM18554.1 hypothetical protein Geob_0181 [Geotalea daltonii FRC-32]
MSKNMINVMMGLFVALVFGISGCGGATNSNNPGATQTQPVANAGSSMRVITGAVVQLDGSASKATIGTLTYIWHITAKPSGSNATLSAENIVNPTFTPDVAGTYTIGLVVTDSVAASTESSITVTATLPIAPVANAGTSQSVTMGTVVTLDGSASTVGAGKTASYSWAIATKPSGGVASISNPTTVKPTFIPDVVGTYIFTLTVSDGYFTDTGTVTVSVAHNPGDIVRTIPFPAGISGVSDVVFDSSSQTLLVFAYDVLDNWKVTKIIQIDYSSGATLNTTAIVNPDFFMNQSSEFTKAGDYYYGTSYGNSNGVPQSFIYKIDMNGNVIASFPCPATNAGGFCEGLAWDGQYLWSGASDNKNLTQFSTNGSVHATITAWNYIGTTDVSYDKTMNQLIVSLNNRLHRVDPVTGTENSSVYTGFSRVGDWDGNLFWAVNSSTKQLEGIYIGN